MTIAYRHPMVAAVLLALGACAHSDMRAPDDGLGGHSCAGAIVIDAKDERAGIEAEHDWLNLNFPGARLVNQSLLQCERGPADLMELELPDGSKRAVYFDIGAFFGKWG